MKIIVWGINYTPEQTGIAVYNTGLCEHLVAAGHDVRMVSTFAYYPQWRKAPGDRGRCFRTDVVADVRVHRCWHYVPARPNAWKRMLHEGTFVFTSWLRVLTLPRPDVYIVVSPPLLLGMAAWLAGVFKRRRFLFHVQDMQPDAAVMLGLLKPGLLTRMLYALERFAYRRAAMVSGITPGMLALFSRKSVPADRQVLFPNWTQDRCDETPRPTPGEFRRRLGLRADEFVAVYSGNLGKKQGLDVLLGAAVLLAKGGTTAGAIPVRVIVAGDGVEKAALEARVARDRLHNVILLPLQPTTAYREMLADADVCLVTQQPGSGALFFPSKLLSILAHGRPVIAVADRGGELERAVAEGGFGWSVPPGDAQALAELLVRVANSPADRDARADRGAAWVTQFSPDRVLRSFADQLERRFFSPGRPK